MQPEMYTTDDFLPAKKRTKQKKNRQYDSTRNINSENNNDGNTCPQSIEININKVENENDENIRKVSVPTHRFATLEDNWLKIYTPIVKELSLQIRYNANTSNVEIKAGPMSRDVSNLQKAAEFVKAFIDGFEVDDAHSLLKMDELFVESFEIKDVKTLQGDHLSRAVGRLAGKAGRTKLTIENITNTKIVLTDSKIHILGHYNDIAMARRAISDIIRGSPPSKVYNNLKNVVNRFPESILLNDIFKSSF